MSDADGTRNRSVAADGEGWDEAAERRAAFVGGAVFLVSGAALVAHILTGAPLWAVFAALVVGACVALTRWVWALPEARDRWLATVRLGAVVGVAATAVYDASRWLLVEVVGFHTSPFKALPFFGDALLGGIGSPGLRTAAGIAFHLLNGVTFGIAFVAWFGRRSPWWGVAFALGLEAFMLSLYPGWLDVRSLEELTQISVLGHVCYGLALGFGTRAWHQRRRPTTEVAP